MKCQKCQKETFLPFNCPYCGGHFCSEHRLPENHQCPQIELARAPKEQRQPTTTQKQKPYDYTITYTPLQPPQKKISFSSKEIKHLTVAALLVISIGLSWGTLPQIYAEMNQPLMLATFALILAFSFFTHEIAHKIAAQKSQLWAEFRLTFMGTILTLVSIVSPLFKIISPGAVMVAGVVDRESMGKISIAGPATNITLSSVLLVPAFLIHEYPVIFLLAAAINAWIALFNLIPFGVLDGFKIFLWNKKYWVFVFVASLVLTIVCYKFILQIINL